MMRGFHRLLLLHAQRRVLGAKQPLLPCPFWLVSSAFGGLFGSVHGDACLLWRLWCAERQAATSFALLELRI
jgi:hypothetical protein